jgi:ATP-dependent DNA helicase RecG
MPVPEWADPRLSNDLPSLRARGEGPTIEYMVSFPGQARELGKEIAAFATSNSGLLLLGVADNGDLVGLNAMNSAAGRDELLRRLEGICRGMVKPAITPSVAFAVEGDKVALAISVPKGTQPVYYCNDIPYVRHITQSRPAEPHEVVELVFASRPAPIAVPAVTSDDPAVKLRELASRVAGALHEVLIFSNQLEERSVNPFLQDLKSQIAYAGQVARAAAATDEAENEGVADKLLQFADAAEAVGTYRMYLGAQSWAEFTALVQQAASRAKQLDEEVVSQASWPPESEEWARRRLRELSREVSQLAERGDRAMQDGRIEELQQAVAARGLEIERLAYLPLRNADAEWVASLMSVARRLHLVETKRLYIDGGKSWRELLEIIQTTATALAELAD